MADCREWYPFWKDRPFTDVMSDRRICQEVVERCIKKEVAKVETVSPQRPIIPNAEGRGIRCDVFMADAEGTRYDVEMQAGNFGELPMRYRGYQSVLDSSFWAPGQDYSDLGNTYVIFLCTGNPFGVPEAERRSRYEVRSVVTGTSLAPLETHARWLALDASAWGLERDPGLRNLLRYVDEGVVTEGDDLLRRIDDEVARLNRDPEWRSAVITYEQKYGKSIREKAMAEGLAEGMAKGMAEGTARDLALFDVLEKSGRLHEYRRALADDGFRKELESELGLNP